MIYYDSILGCCLGYFRLEVGGKQVFLLGVLFVALLKLLEVGEQVLHIN